MNMVSPHPFWPEFTLFISWDFSVPPFRSHFTSLHIPFGRDLFGIFSYSGDHPTEADFGSDSACGSDTDSDSGSRSLTVSAAVRSRVCGCHYGAKRFARRFLFWFRFWLVLFFTHLVKGVLSNWHSSEWFK